MSVYTHIIVVQSLSHVWLFCDPMVFCPWNFPGKNTGMSLPFPSAEDLPNPGIKPLSPVSPALTSRFFTNRCHLGSLILTPYSNFPKLFLSYLFKFNFLELSSKKEFTCCCFFIFFYLKVNCFTEFCWFMPNINMNMLLWVITWFSSFYNNSFLSTLHTVIYQIILGTLPVLTFGLVISCGGV